MDNHLYIVNEINYWGFFSAFVKNMWDPLSTSQTKNLVQLCRNIFEKKALSKGECSRAKEVKASVVLGKGGLGPLCELCVCVPMGT